MPASRGSLLEVRVPASVSEHSTPDDSGTTLFVTQVYLPDPAALGQYFADAAAELVSRGHRVLVLTADRGYDDPTQIYPRAEWLSGVSVRRLPFSSFGKRSLAHRLLGASAFLLQVTLAGALVLDLRRVVVGTSPPMCSLAALLIASVRGVPVEYWVMDINPDQVITLGKVAPGSLLVRGFDWLNRRILSKAHRVVTLDRFMADRLRAKGVPLDDKLSVIPPWPHEEASPVAHEHNPFREVHGLKDRIVIMYSGNHSPASPLTTLLEAARQLADEPRLCFAFVGGGLGKREVEAFATQHALPNVLCLPYQPLATLGQSLSAADVHVVTLGNDMVGIIHPSKLYGAMAVARPILFIGPRPSHVSDLLDEHAIGWHVSHGDVERCVAVLREILESPPAHLAAMGAQARSVVESRLSKASLCGQLCDVLEGE